MVARGSAVLVIGLLASLLAGGGGSDAQGASPARSAPAGLKPIPVTVAKAEARAVQRSVETVGSLLPWQDVQVKTEQPGTISRLHADLGDSVGRGKVLAD